MTMSKIFISAAEAAKLLPRGKKVHTFIRVFGWMGADVDRSKVLAAFEGAKVETGVRTGNLRRGVEGGGAFR
ncbi:hypothetical protein [Cupriavidus necator]